MAKAITANKNRTKLNSNIYPYLFLLWCRWFCENMWIVMFLFFLLLNTIKMSVTYTRALLCNQNLIHLYLKQGERDITVLFTGCPLGGQNDHVVISSVKYRLHLSFYHCISLLWKENLQWWSSIPPVSTKQTIISHLNWTHSTQKGRRHITLDMSWFGTGTKMSYDKIPNLGNRHLNIVKIRNIISKFRFLYILRRNCR